MAEYIREPEETCSALSRFNLLYHITATEEEQRRPPCYT